MMPSQEVKDLVPSKTLLNVDTNEDGKIDGFQFDLKNPFYNAEPLGSIKNLFITVDGEKIDPSKVTLIAKGQKISLLHAPTIYSIWWPSYTNIQVFVEKPGGLRRGKHELECVLHLTSTFVYGRELRDEKDRPYREYFIKKTLDVT